MKRRSSPPKQLFERVLWGSRLVMLVAVVSSVLLALSSFYLLVVDVVYFLSLLGKYTDPTLSSETRAALRADVVTVIVKTLDRFRDIRPILGRRDPDSLRLGALRALRQQADRGGEVRGRPSSAAGPQPR